MRHRTRALLGFAAFGLFWGAWGAALPQIQAHAGASDSELGLALLCIGAGAFVSMRPAGAVVDRLGPDVSSVALALFAVSALLPAPASSPLALAGALLVLGALSGAVDVAINAEAAHAEAEGQPAMNLVHAVFSASVVGASVLVGVLRTLGADLVVVLGTVTALLLVIDVALTRIRVPRLPAAAEPERLPLLRIPRPLLILGALAALAYLVENAWQSWSAVYLETTLGAAAGIAALGPALFGASAAAGRLGGHALADRVSERACWQRAPRSGRPERSSPRWRTASRSPSPGSRSPASAPRSAHRPCSASPVAWSGRTSAAARCPRSPRSPTPASWSVPRPSGSPPARRACPPRWRVSRASPRCWRSLARVRAEARALVSRLTFRRGAGVQTRRSDHCRVRGRGQAWTA